MSEQMAYGKTGDIRSSVTIRRGPSLPSACSESFHFLSISILVHHFQHKRLENAATQNERDDPPQSAAADIQHSAEEQAVHRTSNSR